MLDFLWLKHDHTCFCRNIYARVHIGESIVIVDTDFNAAVVCIYAVWFRLPLYLNVHVRNDLVRLAYAGPAVQFNAQISPQCKLHGKLARRNQAVFLCKYALLDSIP